MITPSRELERAALSALPDGAYVAGVDEVGRGALAGPVSVGIAVVGNETSESFPGRLRDSKQISAAVRQSLVEPVRDWVVGSAVGHASAEEIDQRGIIGGLRLAATRASAKLAEAGVNFDVVLLDGSHDWWSADSLFDIDGPPNVPVTMTVKGDASSAVIACASVLAKVERDALMVALDAVHPGYDWARNKGYASPAHIVALSKLGASEYHRRSWHLPGVEKE
ncbi:ribonuclease HII [Arcanobacterium canis]|uniref:ribonuclease HII n=1 Tax=Arcanobacterium canis TaxID=999183 RepID=UPI003611024F